MINNFNVKPKYYLITTTEFCDGKRINVYGIGCDYNGERIEYKSLSSDNQKVAELLNSITSNNLEFCHFKDVIEDYIYQEYSIE